MRKIICRLIGHNVDLDYLIDNKIELNISDGENYTKCKRCGELISYSVCWKKYSYRIIAILQCRLMKKIKEL